MEIIRNKNNNLELISKAELVRETTASVNPLGNYEFTMELFTDDENTPTLIEWDIPELEETEHIGLEFDGKRLEDYDGVFDLPYEAIKLIRKSGYVVPKHFTY